MNTKVLPAFFVGLLCASQALSDTAPHETLSNKLDRVITAWQKANLPLEERVVHLVVGDPGMKEGDLSLPREPTLVQKAQAWVSGLFAKGKSGSKASEETPFAKRWEDADPLAIGWNPRDMDGPEQRHITTDLIQSIAKAHDAKAAIQIVAQGRSVTPVLQAIRTFEGQPRGGREVLIDKLVGIGISQKDLTEVSPAPGNGGPLPSNLEEWAGIWKSEDGNPGVANLETSRRVPNQPRLLSIASLPIGGGTAGSSAFLPNAAGVMPIQRAVTSQLKAARSAGSAPRAKPRTLISLTDRQARVKNPPGNQGSESEPADGLSGGGNNSGTYAAEKAGGARERSIPADAIGLANKASQTLEGMAQVEYEKAHELRERKKASQRALQARRERESQEVAHRAKSEETAAQEARKSGHESVPKKDSTANSGGGAPGTNKESVRGECFVDVGTHAAAGCRGSDGSCQLQCPKKKLGPGECYGAMGDPEVRGRRCRDGSCGLHCRS